MTATLLVVDDESELRHLVRAALEPEGHRVLEAANSAQALAILDKEKVDAVLVDWVLPDGSGLDLIAKILTREPVVRTLLVSGYGTIDTALRALNSGARDFLRKPFSAEMLRATVTAVLEREKPLSPVNTVRREFTRTNINGHSFELVSSGIDEALGDLTCVFEVAQNYAEASQIRVVLPAYIQELAKALIDCEHLPCGKRFWLKMCEEELANHLWAHDRLPASGVIRIEDVSPGQRRWLESMTTVAAPEPNLLPEPNPLPVA